MKTFLIESLKSIVYATWFVGMVIFTSWFAEIPFVNALLSFSIGFIAMCMILLFNISGMKSDVKNSINSKLNWLKVKVTR